MQKLKKKLVYFSKNAVLTIVTIFLIFNTSHCYYLIAQQI